MFTRRVFTQSSRRPPKSSLFSPWSISRTSLSRCIGSSSSFNSSLPFSLFFDASDRSLCQVSSCWSLDFFGESFIPHITPKLRLTPKYSLSQFPTGVFGSIAALAQLKLGWEGSRAIVVAPPAVSESTILAEEKVRPFYLLFKRERDPC